MTMKNKIKALVDSRELSVYEFRKRTGIANKTAYDLYNNPYQYPGRDVMDKICSTFNVQPGEILEWVSDEPDESTGKPDSEEPESASTLMRGASEDSGADAIAA